MISRSQRLKRHFHAINQPPHYPLNSHYFYAYLPPPPTDAARAFVQGLLPNHLTFSQEEKTYRPKEYASGQAPESVSPFVDRLTRFLIAFIGGAFLLVPMLVMAIRPSTTKSLITTCVAVLLFATVVALGFKGKNVETMASTATYAAVLVVFIGTSSSQS
jgi:VIT1/CCC1 family predicted Fe2+/Mn2+ transporter